MGMIAGLRLLARQPTWRLWTLTGFLARLPVTMTLLALVLLGDQVAGSLAVGAQLSGVAMLSSGLSALWRGRMLDRRELTSGLRRDCGLSAAALAALATAAVAAAPVPVLFVLAALLGVAMAALSGGFRALLPAVVIERDLPRANAVEAVFIEVGFVAGPALAGVLAMLLGPVGVLAVMALTAGAAALLASRLPVLHPPAERPAFAPWRLPGVRPVLLIALSMGAAVGMYESLIPARVVVLGAEPELAGPLLALFAVGSAVGGLAASARAESIADVRRTAAWLLVVFGVVLAPAALMPSLALLGVVMLIAGAPIAPLNALGTMRLHGAVPLGRQAEGFSVYVAAVMLGIGAGQTVVGQALPLLGPERLLGASAVVPVLAGCVVAGVLLRRRMPRAGRPTAPDPAT